MVQEAKKRFDSCEEFKVASRETVVRLQSKQELEMRLWSKIVAVSREGRAHCENASRWISLCKRIISCETIHSHWQCHEPLSLTCPAGTKTYIVHPSTFKHIFISFFFLGCLCPFCILCFRCIVTFANFTCSLFSFLLLFSI